VWINPPPIPLTTAEMDHVFDLPYARAPLPGHGDAKIPAWEMIRFSSTSCAAASAAAPSARSPSTRAASSRAARRLIIREIEEIRDKVKGFTGVISDLGGPTANMYRLGCKARDRGRLPQAQLRLPRHLPEPEHRPRPLIKHLPPRARSGRQEDPDRLRPALRPGRASPEYVKELVSTTWAAT
jgi:hypothetical protein